MGRIEKAVFGPDSHVQRFRERYPHLSPEDGSPALKLFVDVAHHKDTVGAMVASGQQMTDGDNRNREIAIHSQAAIVRYDTFVRMGGKSIELFNTEPDFSIDLPMLSELVTADAREDLDRNHMALDEEAVYIRGLELIATMGALLADPETYNPDFIQRTFMRAAAMRQTG